MRFIIAGMLLALSGCATITSGTSQEVSFQTSPEDVVVTITKPVRDPSKGEDAWKDETRVLGKTPLTLRLDRATRQTVTFTKDGYKALTMQLATTLNGYFWGNIITGGIIGSSTDGMTGAMHEYSPSQYFVTLIPTASSSIDAATQLSSREKAKDLIVRRYTNLMADLSRGTGEDLAAVLQLLQIEPSRHHDATRKMQALSQVYPDAVVYADHVIELYLK